MAVGAADFHKAITAIWIASGLDAKFNTRWASANQSKFTVLNDTEASPSQPFPYCVFEDHGQTVTERCSGGSADANTEGRETRDGLWAFRVHARDDGTNSAKVIASLLAEEIMKVFGGHPSVTPMAAIVMLDHGGILQSQYQTEIPIREESRENYSWTVSYKFTLDVPVTL